MQNFIHSIACVKKKSLLQNSFDSDFIVYPAGALPCKQ